MGVWEAGMSEAMMTAMMPEAVPAVLAVAREEFVAAMRNVATGVTVVTTDGPAGRHGVTVSAMTSVSADPPAVLVCVNEASPTAAAIAANKAFCVNLLADDQAAISDTFAGRAGKADRFDGLTTLRIGTDAPALAAALSCFDCRLVETHRFGTHAVFIGLVVGVRHGEGAPLVYHNRAYCRPAVVA
jgi:flavin reductase (DIM6/NTAB) family NADH-FMN oxidoreductase RutF